MSDGAVAPALFAPAVAAATAAVTTTSAAAAAAQDDEVPVIQILLKILRSRRRRDTPLWSAGLDGLMPAVRSESSPAAIRIEIGDRRATERWPRPGSDRAIADAGGTTHLRDHAPVKFVSRLRAYPGQDPQLRLGRGPQNHAQRYHGRWRPLLGGVARYGYSGPLARVANGDRRRRKRPADAASVACRLSGMREPDLAEVVVTTWMRFEVLHMA